MPRHPPRADALPASITTVAERAGVSIATVSRVLNQSKPVNRETRERVEEAVRALGWRANASGRSLAKSRSDLLLVLVPDFGNPFYAQIVQGVEAVARVEGYRILLSDTATGAAPLAAALDALKQRLADGVISLASLAGQQDRIAELERLPWIACSEYAADAKVPHVSIDHARAAQDAVQYLINRGRRRIALLTVADDYRWARQRRDGYEAALRRAKLPLLPELVCVAEGTDYAQGARATGALLALREPPAAVFAVSDTLAIGAIKALRRGGRRVPEDVAVVGFDNLPLADVFEPGLTTIAQPMRELGAVATRMLIERLAGAKPASRTLGHSLVVRESA